jgi:SAM-dependent methyltransferase
MDMQRLQESAYGSDRDYRQGSPHLQHWSLHDRLSNLLRAALLEVVDAGLPATVLEIGAGHGGYTEVALAAGATVTATELSRPSVEHLEHRYRLNPALSARFDPTGDLTMLGPEQFSLVVCASVLHHIPDYETFLRDSVLRHTAPGGTFVAFQDPLWYPTVGRVNRKADRWSFLAWRVVQGRYRQGVATQLRRLRGHYDEENPADMVEYHVVRQGVDQGAVARVLEPAFDSVEVGRYWSTPSAALQRVGTRLGMSNTFYVRARSRGGDASP